MKSASTVRQYYKLSKFSLSFLVTFSSVMSYFLSDGIRFSAVALLLLSVGGFCVTVSANILNQLVEKDSDALMMRTRTRPLASGQMQENEGRWNAVLFLAIGCACLSYFGWPTVVLSCLSLTLYAWVYTPLKKRTPFSVVVGAVPGALPCLIGWVAAGAQNYAVGLLLFFFQFFWQFPHFWAIAWLSHEDYQRASLRLLPSVEGKSKYTALQALFYSIVLIPIGFVPVLIHMAGWISAVVIFVINVYLVILAFDLYRKMTDKAARKLMFSCYIHLPIFFFSLLLDRI